MERIWYLFLYAFKKEKKFEGRACRMEILSFVLVSMVISLFLILMSGLFLSLAGNNENLIFLILGVVFGIITFIWSLMLIVPSLGVACRRLHDINLSGWLQIINYIPFINYIGGLVLFVLWYFIPGTEGTNNYGPVSENY